MTDRRDFLKGSAAAAAATSVLAGAGPLSSARAAAVSEQRQLIFDDRFEAARGVAADLRARGLKPLAFSGDVTTIWYEKLDQQWRKAPLFVGGVTNANTLFMLERFAWEHGHRVVYYADAPSHPVRGWSRPIAAMLATFKPKAGEPLPDPGRAAFDHAKQPLMAWVIGPRVRSA